jgi:tryptophan-rich sensory protein
MEPSWRKPFGILMMLILIILWTIIVASFSSLIGGLPGIIQGIIYAIAGIIWIFPLKPLLAWMETGRFR